MPIDVRIAQLRRFKGWSQEHLADLLNVSRQTVYKWEAGLAKPALEKISRLVELFGCSYDDLLGERSTIDLPTEVDRARIRKREQGNTTNRK